MNDVVSVRFDWSAIFFPPVSSMFFQRHRRNERVGGWGSDGMQIITFASDKREGEATHSPRGEVNMLGNYTSGHLNYVATLGTDGRTDGSTGNQTRGEEAFEAP